MNEPLSEAKVREIISTVETAYKVYVCPRGNLLYCRPYFINDPTVKSHVDALNYQILSRWGLRCLWCARCTGRGKESYTFWCTVQIITWPFLRCSFHYEWEVTKFKCSFCGKKMRSPDALQEHEKLFNFPPRVTSLSTACKQSKLDANQSAVMDSLPPSFPSF